MVTRTQVIVINLLFRHGSPIVLVFDLKQRYPNPRGTLLAGTLNKWVLGKFAIFD